MKLYFKNFKRTRNTTIENIFDMLLSRAPTNKLATYYDKECKQIQCSAFSSRSLGDLVDIVKTYFPNSTEKGIFNKLYNYIDKYNRKCIESALLTEDNYCFLIVFIYCADINKVVIQTNWCIYDSSFYIKDEYYFYKYQAVDMIESLELENTDRYNFKDYLDFIGKKLIASK